MGVFVFERMVESVVFAMQCDHLSLLLYFSLSLCFVFVFVFVFERMVESVAFAMPCDHPPSREAL